MVLYQPVDGVSKDGVNVEGAVVEKALSQQWFHSFRIASNEIHFTIPVIRKSMSLAPFQKPYQTIEIPFGKCFGQDAAAIVVLYVFYGEWGQRRKESVGVGLVVHGIDKLCIRHRIIAMEQLP